ncbi:putative transport protein HsrA [Pigmentiphaga humi]|uniref:Putative transport protein HsrA n=1 Tax=Pigmentiphaga humi TaxID=2478468 RepID=A0A3P4B2Z7_9BURK|nr:MFS transporter [Pigmentiphaga humi]VCU70432.1 putative transport protein HsrA [Pigmentiphaga humi]
MAVPSTDTGAGRQLPALSPRRLALVMLLVTGALFMEILDGTIITTALPAMAQSFGTSAIALNIGVSGYLLALGVFIPVSGWVADRYGARRVFVAAIALFTLASALCGMADDLPTFFVLRILQGIAGAMMVPVGRLVVMKYTPKARLMAAMSALVWPALVAPVLGPPLGGFITEHFGWRWIFYLNVPLGVIGLAAAWMIIPGVAEPARRRFDLRGFLLCGTATFSLLFALEQLVDRLDAPSLALLAAGIALLALSIRHLARAPEPLIDLRSWRIPTFRASLRGGSLSRMAIGSAPFLLPLMFQVGFGYDAFRSGLLVLAVFAGNLAMKAVTTPVLRHAGYRPVLVWNGLLCALSIAACALLTPGTPLAVTLALLFVGGAARSMQFTALSTLAYADVPKPQMSDANGLFTTISQLSMAAGITLAALGIRVGHLIAERFELTGAGMGYRIAFLIAAAVCVLGIIDALRLPAQAGDHFVSRAA